MHQATAATGVTYTNPSGVDPTDLTTPRFAIVWTGDGTKNGTIQAASLDDLAQEPAYGTLYSTVGGQMHRVRLVDAGPSAADNGRLARRVLVIGDNEFRPEDRYYYGEYTVPVSSLSRDQEPPVGTWVKDRHGGLSYRQEAGWGEPGTEPFGRWEGMWDARGPYTQVGPWGVPLDDATQTIPAPLIDEDRCPYVATDPITTRRPREDGWRCGHDTNTPHNHTLFTPEGEGTLYAGTWVLPDERAAQKATAR